MTTTVAIVKRRGVPIRLRMQEADGGTLNFMMMLRAFLQRGIGVHVFTTTELAEDSRESHCGITVHRLHVSTRPELHGMQRDLAEGLVFSHRLTEYLGSCGLTFDYLHTHHWSSFLPPWVCVAGRAMVHVHTPHLLAIEKARVLQLSNAAQFLDLERSILHCADRVIALSLEEKRSIVENYCVSPSKVRVIPNGVSGLFFQNRYRDNVDSVRDPVRIVSVGRLARQKGFDILLRAVAAIRDAGVDVTCTIIGGTYMEVEHETELRELVRQHALSAAVMFVGPMARRDLAAALSRASVYIQASRYESQGIAIAEAMAMGLPIVATASPAIAEMVRNGWNGLLVSEGDHCAIAEGVMYLRRNPQLVVEMAGRNRIAAKDFRWAYARDATMECFKSVCCAQANRNPTVEDALGREM